MATAPRRSSASRHRITAPLRSLMREAAPLGRLPVLVVRQLVGYYGDWRRSRDILNDADDGTARLGSGGLGRTLRWFHA